MEVVETLPDMMMKIFIARSLDPCTQERLVLFIRFASHATERPTYKVYSVKEKRLQCKRYC